MKFKYLVIFLLIAVACSCTKEEAGEFETPLVVEGWIESGNCPVVLLSAGIEATAQYRSVNDLPNLILRYADVSVEHDGKVYKLSSRLSDDYTMRSYYTTGELKGEVGGEYKLLVEWNGMKATATTTIPEPHPIDTLYANPTRDINGMYTITASITDDGQQPRYYKFFVSSKKDKLGYKPAFMGTFSNESRNGTFDITVHNGANYIRHSQTIFFKGGDEISIKLATMQEDIYPFWTKFDQNCLCAALPVVSYYESISGNVEGALGYWAGYGITEQKICLEK